LSIIDITSRTCVAKSTQIEPCQESLQCPATLLETFFLKGLQGDLFKSWRSAVFLVTLLAARLHFRQLLIPKTPAGCSTEHVDGHRFSR